MSDFSRTPHSHPDVERLGGRAVAQRALAEPPSRRGAKRVSLAARISSIGHQRIAGHSFRLELRPAEPRRRLEGRGADEEEPLALEDRRTPGAGTRALASRRSRRRPPPRARPPRAARAGLPPRTSHPARRHPRRLSRPRPRRGRRTASARRDPRRPAGSRARPRAPSGRSRDELASARNQRSRSSHGTAAFAGDVDGRTKRSVSPSRRSWRPCAGRPPNGPR